MDAAIHTTMDRRELLTDEAQPVVRELDALVRAMRARGVLPGSWYGTVPPPLFSRDYLRDLINRALGRPCEDYWRVGTELRDERYEPLPGAADDGRLPWFQYWQIAWALLRGPALRPGMTVLDAGGASSLLSCLLASRGIRVLGVDVKPRLVQNARRIARIMRWPMDADVVSVEHLGFAPGTFDHAYAIGVFHHLTERQRSAALDGLHRCLKPGGQLMATFDYRNSAPYVMERLDFVDGQGMVCEEDIRRVFTARGKFCLAGDGQFVDRGASQFAHEARPGLRYTFAGIRLARMDGA